MEAADDSAIQASSLEASDGNGTGGVGIGVEGVDFSMTGWVLSFEPSARYEMARQASI